MRAASIITLSFIAALAMGCERDAKQDAKPAPVAKAKPATPQITGPIPMEEYVEPVVGGAKMSVSEDILSNLAKSTDHTVLVQAIRTAGLEDVFKQGKVTFFAPTNAAFDRLPGGRQAFLADGARERLIDLVSYHVVPGELGADAMASRVMAGNGTAQLMTAHGKPLKATVSNGSAMIVDGRGGTARIDVPNVVTSNGVVYVINTVLMP